MAKKIITKQTRVDKTPVFTYKLVKEQKPSKRTKPITVDTSRMKKVPAVKSGTKD